MFATPTQKLQKPVSNKPSESWIIRVGSRAAVNGLSSTQVPVPPFLPLRCARGQPRRSLLLFCPTAQLRCFRLGLAGLAGLLSAWLDRLSRVGITPTAGRFPASGLPASAGGSALHCDQFVFSPLSLSTLRPVVAYQENRRGTGGGAKGPSPAGVDADSPSAGKRGKMAHFEWGAWPSLLKPRPQP